MPHRSNARWKNWRSIAWMICRSSSARYGILPEAFLPYLAWALSVDVWDGNWPLSRKREVVSAARSVHRHKGTIAAVRRALAALDVAIAIVEWFESGEPVHTFRLDVLAQDIIAGGFGIDQQFLDAISASIDHVKPARSHYRIRVADPFATSGYIRTALRDWAEEHADHDVIPRATIATALSVLRTDFRVRIFSKITHDVLRHP
jgi:phage tail P2-like protein